MQAHGSQRSVLGPETRRHIDLTDLFSISEMLDFQR